MIKVTRRDLARLIAAATAARTTARLGAQTPAQSPASSAYIGPLTGVTKGIEDRRFDPVLFARDRYAAAPRRLRFSATSRADAEGWQNTLRAKLIELVGGFPMERRPLRPVTLETRKFAGYTREKLVFDSAEGVSVLAY